MVMLFFDESLAEEMLQFAEDYLNQLSADGIVQKIMPHVGFMYILDATQPFDPSDDGFENAVLAAGKLNVDDWPKDKPYQDIAKAKARLAWREKRDTMEIVDKEPWRLRDGDCRYAGAIYLKGIVISFSGVEPYNDDKICRRTSSHLVAILRTRAESVLAKQSAFIDSSKFPNLSLI